MQLVLAGAVGDELVVRAAEAAHHVAEGEDDAEDELGVVGGGARGVARRRGRGVGGCGGCGRGCPALLVDAFGWVGCVSEVWDEGGGWGGGLLWRSKMKKEYTVMLLGVEGGFSPVERAQSEVRRLRIAGGGFEVRSLDGESCGRFHMKNLKSS